jgi:hypothetical protein
MTVSELIKALQAMPELAAQVARLINADAGREP